MTPNTILSKVGIGHDAPPARAWTLLLVTFVGISVYGNTAHALLTGHGWAAAAWFAVAPVALFWVTHLVAKTAGRSPHGAVKWLVWLVAIPAALTVSAMAFVVSFRALQAWTLHQGGDELASILLPLIVDIMIALSSMMVLALRPATGPTQVHQPATTEQFPAQEPVTTAAVRTPASVPMPTPAEPTQVVLIEQLTATGAQRITAADKVITTPIPAQYPTATTEQLGEQHAVTWDNAPVDHLDEPAAQRDARVIPLVSTPAEQEVVTGDRTAADEQLPSTQQVRTTPVTAQELPTGEAADDQSATAQEIDPERDAQVLIERGSRLDEEKLTDLIARIAAGESYSSISETTGVSRNTIRKIAGQVPTEPEPVPVA